MTFWKREMFVLERKSRIVNRLLGSFGRLSVCFHVESMKEIVPIVLIVLLQIPPNPLLQRFQKSNVFIHRFLHALQHALFGRR